MDIANASHSDLDITSNAMKKSIFTLAILLWTVAVMAQHYEEVVYLKNGSRIKGKVVEMTSEQVKVEIYDGSVFVYKLDEIEKVIKETTNSKPKPLHKKPIFYWKTRGYRHIGYTWFIETEYTSGKNFIRPEYLGLGTTHGYQFNPYLFVGAGAEFQAALSVAWGNYETPEGKPDDINNGKNKIESVLRDTEVAGAEFGAAIYGNIRLFLFDNKYSPYFDLRIGYSTAAKGCYLSPMIGASIGRFNIAIGGVFQQISLNNTYCDYTYKYVYSPISEYRWVEENERTESSDKFRGGFNIRVGINF